MRPHYLAELGDDLESALALIVHDLIATQVMNADDGFPQSCAEDMRLVGVPEAESSASCGHGCGHGRATTTRQPASRRGMAYVI